METCENNSIELSLKWNNFTENIVSSLESSFGNQDFVDVTLVCEEGSIKAHRLILSACSYFFCRILKENVCAHPVIILKGITLAELETLLMYMYHGEARTNEHDFPRLLEAAQFLEIRGLTSTESSQGVPYSVNGRENLKIYKCFNNNLEQIDGQSKKGRQNQPLPSVDFVDVSSTSNSLISAANFNNEEKESNESLNLNVKQEIDEEENTFTDNIPVQIDFLQSLPISVQPLPVIKAQPTENCRTFLSENICPVQENTLLQEQRKLAFYEPRPCPKCKRVYRDAATLRTHMSIMHEVLPQKIPCSCGMFFDTKHDMYTHRKKGHKR